MMSALIFLLWRSFVNRSRARLRRLRQPKYLLGALAGGLYFAWYFGQVLWMGGRGGGAGAGAWDQGLVAVLGVVILGVLVVGAWIFPQARAALVFSEAEVAFLFPAPVSRRTLLHFKLLRAQLAILVSVVLLTVLTGRLFVDGAAWMRMAGWWVILSGLSLHFLGASFARTLLLEQGFSNWRRRAVVVVVLAAVTAGTLWWGRRKLLVGWPELGAEWRVWRDWAEALLATPPLSSVAVPFRWLLGPYLAGTPGEFLRALPAALGLVLGHYVWVMRANVAFEEASVDLSRRMADRLAAAREGRHGAAGGRKRRPAPFRLGPLGPAPVAFLWKNLIQAAGNFRLRTLLMVLVALVVFLVVLGPSGPRGRAAGGMMFFMAAMFYVWSLLLGPQLVRCDFRQDLGAMELLKLYPVRGWQVALGELLAPVVILSVGQWALLLVAALALAWPGGGAELPAVPWLWWLAAVWLGPVWNALALVIPNAAVLLFPTWFQIRPEVPQGIETTGQRLLLLFGQMALLAVALLPAGLAFAGAYLAVRVAGAEAVAPGAGVAGAWLVLLAETAAGLWLLGRMFERFDRAAESS